jgi:hypothetical protein
VDVTRNVCRFLVVAISLMALVHLSCGDEAAGQSGQKAQPAVPAALPEGLFVKESLPNPLGVKEAKGNTKQGDAVVLFGSIGGRPVPFVEGRAVFLLADETLPPCTDGCATPWDFCCTPPNVIMEGLATVQVLGPDGKALKTALQNINGLQPMAHVVVAGRVAKRDMHVFVVNADRIYVKPAGN